MLVASCHVIQSLSASADARRHHYSMASLGSSAGCRLTDANQPLRLPPLSPLKQHRGRRRPLHILKRHPRDAIDRSRCISNHNTRYLFITTTMAERRVDQIFSAGLGSHFTSPIKKRDRKKSNIFVRAPLQEMKRKHLLAKLALLREPPASSPSQSLPIAADDGEMVDGTLEVDNVEDPPLRDQDMADITNEQHQTRRRIVPNEAGIRLYNKWIALIPNLVDPFLAYITSSTGSRIVPVSDDLHSECGAMCVKTSTRILCLYFDRMIISHAFRSQLTYYM
jgi:hypothetical protein